MVGGGGDLESSAGHFYLTRPGEPHGGVGSVTHPAELYWLQIDLDDLASMTRGSGLEGRVADKLWRVHSRQFPCDRDSVESFDRLLREYRRPGREAEIVAKSALLSLLGSVLRTGSEPSPATHSPVSPVVRSALRLMEQRCTERVTVSEIAEALGGDARWLHDHFERELRTRPVEQLARIRVEKACDSLRRNDEPITRIAHTLGFSSSQYFATVFRRHTGLTPRRYRALHAVDSAETPNASSAILRARGTGA